MTLGLLALASAAPASTPAVPAAIAVPPGHKLDCRLHASGVQVYRSVTTPTGLGWTLDGPLATLSDAAGVAAFHYEGPSWEGVDGGKVVADKSVAVRSAPAPDPRHDTPWLLIKVKRDGSIPGRLAATAYVQRVDTAGGLAPDAPPARVGTKVGVPYTATYCFYEPAP